MTTTQTTYQCGCGQATGVACEWTGPLSELVVVEWMPAYLRDSHRAAGNYGSHPANGSRRLAVTQACADLLCEGEDEADCRVIDRDPARYAVEAE